MREGVEDTASTGLSASERKITGDVSFIFDGRTFFPANRILVSDERESKLGSRAASILLAFLRRPGEILSKDELVSAAWPSTFVEEGNLRVHINALRRALHTELDGGKLIENVVGQGYRFTAKVERVGPLSSFLPDSARAEIGGDVNLPLPLTRIMGRSKDIVEILHLMEKQRLVSIVGPGGTGKTTIALAVAHRASASNATKACFVDLSTIADSSLVPHVVAASLNVSLEIDDPIASLVRFLKPISLLLVLDNCEHVVAAAADLAEAILAGAPNVRLLATSHESLSAQGEWLFRLQSLGFPGEGDDLTIDEAMSYPSIELFVDRAMASNQSWCLRERDLDAIAEICRGLDGIPLAIEIAASRTEAFGVTELAARLQDRLKLLSVGRRSAVQRHQTIRKMLDWSHEILTNAEQVLLRRLAVFAGTFSLEAASLVAGDEYLNPFAVTEGIASLVRKSLLHPTSMAGVITYRLLESTRLYALEKLNEAEECFRVRRLHVDYVTDLMRRAEREWQDTKRRAWLETYEPLLGDARQALRWAFSPEGDRAAGVILSSLLMPLGLQMGLVDEFRERVETAIGHARELSPPELLAEMRLNLVYGILNQNQIQPVDFNFAGLVRAAHLANKIGDDRHRIEPQIVSAAFNMGMGNYAVALAHAEHAMELSEDVGDDIAMLGARRILSQVTHFNGQHGRAAELAKSVLQHPIINIPIAYGNVQTDRRVSMRIVLARTLWLEGYADRALAVVDDAIELSSEDGPLALCQALSLAACPILLWRGYHDLARQRTQMLLDAASRYTLGHWHSWGKLFEGVLNEREEGNPATPGLPIATQGNLQRETLATLTNNLSYPTSIVSDRATERSWSAPELLRVEAERSWKADFTDTAAAESMLSKAIGMAQEQKAVAWELRSASSLARIWNSSGRGSEARKILVDVRERFPDGEDCRDVIEADRILSELN
jgi:predicted ATPase/DNA-binding winged helix-turn-helix (wHTH) protein